MKLQHRSICKDQEVKMINVSALMEAKEHLDSECPRYVRGFIEGYYHCLKLAAKLDDIKKSCQRIKLPMFHRIKSFHSKGGVGNPSFAIWLLVCYREQGSAVLRRTSKHIPGISPP